MKIENWGLVTLKRHTWVTFDMMKNKELYLKNVMLVGRIESNNNSNFAALIKKVNGNIVYTDNGDEVELGTPSVVYAEFAEAVSKGMPIIYNFLLEKGNLLRGNVYLNNILGYFERKVVGQNLEDRTILLENGTRPIKAYVVWSNINPKMAKHVNDIEEKKIFKTFYSKQLKKQLVLSPEHMIILEMPKTSKLSRSDDDPYCNPVLINEDYRNVGERPEISID